MIDSTFNFDNSFLEDFASCEARAVAKHALGRASRNKKYEADLGGAGHSAMEVYFGGYGKEQVLNTFLKRYDQIIPPGEMPNSDKAEMMERGNLELIMNQWCDSVPLSRFPFEVVELEQTKGIEIEPGYKLWYKRDMLVRVLATGELAPVDHKFRFGQINAWWTGKFKNNSQFSCYLWCTEKETGNPVSKQYVNAISFNKLPTSTRKCKLHKVPFVECRKEHCDFQLLTYSRTEEQKAKWYRDMLVMAKQAKVIFQGFGKLELLRFAPRRGTFNGGCVFCEFQDWCRNGFDPAMVDDYTVEYWWKPWEGEKESGSVEQVGSFDGQAGQTFPPSQVRWFWRQVSDQITAKLITATTGESPGNNWVELTEKMALKALWQKGKEPWMEVWNRCPQAQEAMAEWARGQQEG